MASYIFSLATHKQNNNFNVIVLKRNMQISISLKYVLVKKNITIALR